MKKLLISILLVLSCAGQSFAFSGVLAGVMGAGTGGSGPSYDVGFDFWSSSSRGSLGANETYVLSNDDYPITRGGATFGWTTEPLRIDDNPGETDRRLLSLAVVAGGSPATFKITELPSGTYKIWLAAGDDNNSRSQDIIIKDNTTTIATISSNTSGYVFVDATGTNMGSSTWISNGGGSSISVSITSGTLNVVLGTSGTTTLNFLRLQKQ